MTSILIHMGAFCIGALTSYVSMYLMVIPAFLSLFLTPFVILLPSLIADRAGLDAVSISSRLAKGFGGLVFFGGGILQRMLMAWAFLLWFGYFSEPPSSWFVGIFALTAFLPVPNLTYENNIGFSLGQIVGTVVMWRLLIV
ncbi:MAG TPA: hypothetical protein V6D19_13715 [Stenomitos sp.]